MSGRSNAPLNIAIFATVFGIILVTFGLLMYWAVDKETYGTSFVSTGSSFMLLGVIIAIVLSIRKRLQPTHIIDDPRIAYIFTHQIASYSSGSATIQMPSTSSTTNLLSVHNLSIIPNNIK
jgi:hypothetical protein